MQDAIVARLLTSAPCVERDGRPTMEEACARGRMRSRIPLDRDSCGMRRGRCRRATCAQLSKPACQQRSSSCLHKRKTGQPSGCFAGLRDRTACFKGCRNKAQATRSPKTRPLSGPEGLPSRLFAAHRAPSSPFPFTLLPFHARSFEKHELIWFRNFASPVLTSKDPASLSLCVPACET